MGVRLRGIAALAALVILLVTPPAPAAAEGGIHFVPDVVAQFDALALRGDGLAFDLGVTPASVDVRTCKHFQGVARTQGPDGTPYLLVSKSGNDPGFQCIAGDDPGNLFIVRMGSRDRDGERLRTNRLRREWIPFVLDEDGLPVIGPNGLPLIWTKPPDPRDTTAALITFEGAWPYYGHPGGMQIVGDVLAMGVEKPFGGGPENVIMFLDVSNPEAPSLMSQFSPEGKAGLVALAPVRNGAGAGLRYLMLITGGDNDVVRLYRSRSTAPDDENGPTDLKSSLLDWDLLITVTETQLEATDCSGGAEWPTGGPLRSAFGHQAINFVREGSLDGALYAIGGRNDGLAGEGNDFLELYRVNVDLHGNPSPCLLTPIRSKHVSSFPFNGHGDSAALSAAGGVYVSPSGELIVYATEYENLGPFELRQDGTPGRRTVRFVEWRHRDLVRPGSPTLRPMVTLPQPPAVDEGASLALEGAGAPPSTRAWIQLYEDDDAGALLPGFADDDDWLQVDFSDRGADAFDDLILFDATTGTEYWENAGSWRWFAHSGCTISANDFPTRSANFPGPSTVLLTGTGEVHQENDLDALDVHVLPGTTVRISPVPEEAGSTEVDFDDDIEGVTFHHEDASGNPVGDCESYYAASIGVAWDLDNDGSYETDGSPVTLSAVGLDGPGTATIGARAQHPIDATPLGTGFGTLAVSVRNVPPILARFGLFDTLGLQVGVDVPFALHGLPLVAAGAFTDPGLPDRQTATLDWGDGVVEPSSAFDVFADAFGGATGELRRQHLHALAGDYTVTLDLTDDDGGLVRSQVLVRILTAVQAVGELIGLLDEAIADATSEAQLKALLEARKALAGSVEGLGNNGALDKLESDIIEAALVKIRQAIADLEAATAAGADTDALIALLEQIAALLEGA